MVSQSIRRTSLLIVTSAASSSHLKIENKCGTIKMNFLVLFLFTLKVHQLGGSLSGLYTDNGKDQTVIERRMTKRETARFESGLSNILGLPRTPRRPKISASNGSAPVFLKGVYDLLEGEKSEDDFDLEFDDYQVAKESDAIMTFVMQKNYVHNMRHEKGKRLFFDLSAVPIENTVIGSELRLFKLRKQEPEEYTIKIFEVTLDLNGEKELKYIDGVNLTNEFEGWSEFNVTSSFILWTAFPSRNRGFYVSLHKQSSPNHEISVDAAGLILSATEELNYQPFLVAFFKYSAHGSKSRNNRHIRDVDFKKNSDNLGADFSRANSNPFTPLPSWSLRSCQLQTLYVNFEELKWHDWIVAPKGYAAYYCSGMCDFPLHAQMNATNHAIVQTLVHLLYPSMAPRACCAPTKLGTLSLLYYLADNSVILKKFKNMIVLSCGCH